MTKSLSPRSSLMRLALGIRLTFGALNLLAQTPNLQTAVENAQTPQDQKIQQLQERLEQIQEELIELKRANSAQPETHHVTSAKASGPPPALSESEPEISDPSNPKSEPFAFADFTWLTGNARTKDTPYATKFFTPEIRSDAKYTYDFRHPDRVKSFG
jgi:type II secretory pathway pseudopilin PulG